MGGSWVRICQRSDSKQKEKIRSASSLISMAKEVVRFKFPSFRC